MPDTVHYDVQPAEESVLQSVAILFHPRRRKAVEEAEWLAGELQRRDVDVRLGSGWDRATARELVRGRELVVALGGDGTIIHVARLIARCEIPLLGINLGRVGFLAELTPQDLHDRLEELMAGKYWIERRSMLHVELHGGDRVEHFLCLNEVAVARGLAPRAIHIKTTLDGDEFMTYTADGVLVVTATGSTAYSLAAGGPILYPEDTDFMLTPVAPHLHIGRSIVVPGSATVNLMLDSDRSAVMSVDGADERPLTTRHTVTVCRSKLVSRFARLGPCTYFYAAIAQRLR